VTAIVSLDVSRTAAAGLCTKDFVDNFCSS